jgi:hypothetical protein
VSGQPEGATPGAIDAVFVVAVLASMVVGVTLLTRLRSLEGWPVTAEEMSWLMHRSCSVGLPAPRNLSAVPGPAHVRVRAVKDVAVREVQRSAPCCQDRSSRSGV